MERYLRWRDWWIIHASEVSAFKWGFAIGVTVMGFAAILVVSA